MGALVKEGSEKSVLLGALSPEEVTLVQEATD